MVSMLLVTLLTFWVWTLCAFSKLQFGVQVVALVSGSSDHPRHESCISLTQKLMFLCGEI